MARFGGPEAEALPETIASLSEPERQYQPYLERAVQYLREREWRMERHLIDLRSDT